MIESFDKHDWNHMHDCILHCTWETTKKKSTREELIQIYNQLPEDLKNEAIDWGMSDTLWRDKFIEWYQLNIKK